MPLVNFRMSHLQKMPSEMIQRFQFSTEKEYKSCPSEVIFTELNSAAIITLNRPKALNALNLNMIRAIYPKLKEWNDSKKITHVIIDGVGEKAFCAGGDILAVSKSAQTGDSLYKEFFKQEYYLNDLIGRLQKPYISLLNGITMGGGVGLSVHGSHRVCSEKTLFAMPETGIGLFPDVGGGHFLANLKNHFGTFLALTGHRLRGADVVHAGVGTHYVLSEKISLLKETLANESGLSAGDIDAIIQTHSAPLPAYSLQAELPLIQEFFSLDSVERIHSGLKSNGAKHPWCAKQDKHLTRLSPTSLKISHRQLQEIRKTNMSLTEEFVMEYRLSQRCLENHDFHEGVRAVIVDKDNSPKWKPATLEEVTDSMVDSYFAPFSDPTREWKPKKD